MKTITCYLEYGEKTDHWCFRVAQMDCLPTDNVWIGRALDFGKMEYLVKLGYTIVLKH